MLTQLAGRFDYVVIDSPPTLPVTDAVVLSSLVDGVILVAGSGLVQRDQLAHALENLESVAGRVLGVVLNRVPSHSPGGYGGYGYGTYSYATPDDEATRRERKRVDQP
jgi:Mrp family chromosome partitioning ATPase